MIKKIVPLLLLLISLNLYSQPDSTKYHPNYLFLGLNADLLTTRDQNQSPLIYYGMGGGFELGFYREGEKFIHELNIENHGAMALPLGDDINGSYSIYFGQLDYGLLYKPFFQYKTWKFKYGGYWHYKALMRLHGSFSNNSISYDVLSGLDASITITRDFTFLKRNFCWENQWRTSLFSFSLEPAYSYPAPKGFTQSSENTFESIIKSIDLYSFIGVTGLSWETKVWYLMHNQNRWEIFHHWQFHQLNHEQKRFAAFHSAGIKLYFNL